jgi:hypothetical protein
VPGKSSRRLLDGFCRLFILPANAVQYNSDWRENACQTARFRLKNKTYGNIVFAEASHAIRPAMKDYPVIRPESSPPETESRSEENWWDYCPICSAKLINQKCKYVCSNPKCNFFMSCSEFDL